MQRRVHARRHLDAECWFQLNSPLEESLINFLRSGPHLLNETTGKPVANEAPIWKSSKQYVRVETKSGTSLAKNKRQESIMKALLRNYVNGSDGSRVERTTSVADRRASALSAAGGGDSVFT